MRICISRQMSCFKHFSFFGEKQNCAEFFETDGKLLVSIVRLELFIWRERVDPPLCHHGTMPTAANDSYLCRFLLLMQRDSNRLSDFEFIVFTCFLDMYDMSCAVTCA